LLVCGLIGTDTGKNLILMLRNILISKCQIENIEPVEAAFRWLAYHTKV
jgi:hypothetical protein